MKGKIGFKTVEGLARNLDFPALIIVSESPTRATVFQTTPGEPLAKMGQLAGVKKPFSAHYRWYWDADMTAYKSRVEAARAMQRSHCCRFVQQGRTCGDCDLAGGTCGLVLGEWDISE